MANERPNTLQKALAVNLDPTKFGTLAEIGAGQEVSRFFFQAGGAAGTIAKTMSAYDMQVSDAIYGAEPDGRYVTRSRLEKMLDREFGLVIERSAESRPPNSTFFAFADTVAAKSYKTKGDGHGWVGIQMQLYPKAESSRIILHVRMKDGENRQQQEALGILGVNLIYGAYNLYRFPEQLIDSLLDDVGTGRIEIDMIEFSGPYFENVDNRLMALQLVKVGYTNAVLFTPAGDVVQPADAFYKRDILVLRGSFRPFTNVHWDMIKCGKEQFIADGNVDESRMITLAEITMASLMVEGEIDTSDFLSRVDIACHLGLTVLISNYLRFFRLRGYLGKFTKRRIGIVLGVPNIHDIFDEHFYEGLEGETMEAFGKLFADETRVYVYPWLDEDGQLITADTLRVPATLKFLYQHCRANKLIVPLTGHNDEVLKIRTPDILEQIKRGDGPWKSALPDVVTKEIIEKRLFEYATI